MRDVFASETAGCDKFSFLDEIGLIPKSEASSLKISIGVSDAAKEKRLDEIAERYFKCAERGRQSKSLDVEIRDRVADMTLDEKRQWVADALEKSKTTMPKELNQKTDAQRIVFMMGMNETPQVVSKAEFERYVEEQQPTVVYRGVSTIDTMTAKEMQFQMAYDSKLPFVSDGIYGGGLYFSTKHETALGYGNGEEYGEHGVVSTCAIRKDAKVYEYDASEIRAYRKALGTREASIAAMCYGYDAMKIDQGSGEFFYIVFNKAALIMRDPHESAHEEWDGSYWYAVE